MRHGLREVACSSVSYQPGAKGAEIVDGLLKALRRAPEQKLVSRMSHLGIEQSIPKQLKAARAHRAERTDDRWPIRRAERGALLFRICGAAGARQPSLQDILHQVSMAFR